MNMNSVDVLLLFDVLSITPTPPLFLYGWIDNLSNHMVTNNGDRIVFNAP